VGDENYACGVVLGPRALSAKSWCCPYQWCIFTSDLRDNQELPIAKDVRSAGQAISLHQIRAKRK